MNRDLLRLLLTLIFSLAAGIISGYPLFCMLTGLLIYILWYLNSVNNLLLWMRQGKRIDPPDVPGLIDEITHQYFKLRNRHKKRKKKLTSYLKRFKETIRALPDAFVILGENNEIKWANEKAKEYLGIIYQEDIDQRVINLIRTPELVNFIKNCPLEHAESEYSIDIISPVNSGMYLEIRLIHFGKSEKLLVARNISSVHRVNKMRTDFIANASHELKTPLTVISGYLESLEDEFSTSRMQDLSKRISKMKSQTERMNRLIEDLLNLSLLETAEDLSNVEPVNVTDLLSAIVEEAKLLNSNPEHTFHLDTEKNLWIKGNKSQLYSAFSNIIFNAVYHTSPPGNIFIRWFSDNSGGVFEAEDSGDGISPEYIPRLTERFFRIDRSRSREYGGAGLGLSIVKHILANHNSTLEIESKPGVGSIFRIRFPGPLILDQKKIESQAI